MANDNEAQRAIAECLASLDAIQGHLDTLQLKLTGVYQVVVQAAPAADVARAIDMLTACAKRHLTAADALAPGGLTVRQFCGRNHLSKSGYYGMRREGRGPVETRYGEHVRITLAAEQTWRTQRAARRAGFVPVGPTVVLDSDADPSTCD
jgi:hypothetical protein